MLKLAQKKILANHLSLKSIIIKSVLSVKYFLLLYDIALLNISQIDHDLDFQK